MNKKLGAIIIAVAAAAVVMAVLLIWRLTGRKRGLAFAPFGKNTCSEENCPPENELNPGFYKICWLRYGMADSLKNCDQAKLVDAIIANFNCVCPTTSALNVDVDGIATTKMDHVAENEYFVELANKVARTAWSRRKLVVITPNLFGGRMVNYYNNLIKDSEFKKLYSFVTKFDRKFIKGVVYDIEYWDDDADRNEDVSPDCFQHGPGSHRAHHKCYVQYLRQYLGAIAKKWARLEPTWEIYMNTYLNADLVADGKNSGLVKVLQENYNLGFQNQSYTFCPDRIGTSDAKLVALLGSAKKLVWGGTGYKTGGGFWKKSDVEKCMESAKKKGYYGFFMYGGSCYLFLNEMLDSGCDLSRNCGS